MAFISRTSVLLGLASTARAQLVFLVPPAVAAKFKLLQGVLGANRQPRTTNVQNPTHGRQVKKGLRIKEKK